MDYREMVAFHERMGADITIGVISVPIEQGHRFGIVTLDAEDRIVCFVEKPRFPTSNLASMGIYVFDRQLLVERIVEDAADAASVHDFGHNIIPMMVKRDKVFAYKFNGYWEDIGTIDAYYAANMELTHELPPFSLDGDWHVLTKNTNLPPPEIFPMAIVRNSFVSRGCIIKGTVMSSILSPGVVVEDQAIVRSSVIMANTIIDKYSVIERCVLDEEVKIDRFCHIGFGKTLIPGNWDINVLGRGVEVPSYTCIGRNCMILPDVGPADFTLRVIPSGTVMSHKL